MNRTPGTVIRSVPSTSTAKAGLAALAVAGVLDPLQLFALGTPDSPLGAIITTTSALGVVTLLGVAAAWRGNRAGLLVAITARVVDTLLGIPAFFLDQSVHPKLTLGVGRGVCNLGDDSRYMTPAARPRPTWWCTPMAVPVAAAVTY
jgi:hypothetical protein